MAKYCMNCGAPLEEGLKFCLQCGAPVEQDNAAEDSVATPQAASEPQPVKPQPDELRYCMNCGAPIEEGLKFCMKCGAPVEQESAADVTVATSQTAVGVQPVKPHSVKSRPIETQPAMPQAVEPREKATSSTKQNSVPVALVAVLIVCVLGGGVVGAMAYTKTGPFAQNANIEVVKEGSSDIGIAEGSDAGSAAADEGSEAGSEAGSSDEEGSSIATSKSDALSDEENGSSETSANTSAGTNATAAQDHTKGTNAASTSDDYYVLPESSTRVYSASELSGLSAWDLKVARNEIFARYGRGFDDTALQDYFNSKSWYTRKYSPEEFDSMTSPLNDTERANIDVIKSLEPASNFS